MKHVCVRARLLGAPGGRGWGIFGVERRRVVRDGSRATGHLCGPVPAAHLCGPVPAALTAGLHPPRRAIPRRNGTRSCRPPRQEGRPPRQEGGPPTACAQRLLTVSMPRLHSCRRAFTPGRRRAQRRSPPRNARSAAVGAARPHARNGSLNLVRTAVVQNSRLQIAIARTAHRRPSCCAHTTGTLGSGPR